MGLTLTPMRRATSWSCAEARIARPIGSGCTNRCSAIMSAKVTHDHEHWI